MKRIVASLLFVLLSLPALAQHEHSHAMGRAIEFPDVEGYFSLTCDFHMHSVFSDGSVWPDIRVQEALRDNLDCIAITEHLEYQPHIEDIPHPDRNRAFNLAARMAASSDLIVISGTEITRSLPFGHANSIFIEDAQPDADRRCRRRICRSTASRGIHFHEPSELGLLSALTESHEWKK